MHILIHQDGALSLEEHEEMKSFSIVDNTSNNNRSALENISVPDEDDHYWVDAQAVVDLSPQAQDKQWVDNFWKMLKAVEPYGYFDSKNKRVKAHVENKA